MVFDKEFKEAITSMPEQEKDKLLLRLLKKDMNLAERLYFELVDNSSVEDRRKEVSVYFSKNIEQMLEYEMSPGYIMMYLRDMSGSISAHVRATKDKYGEVELNILMLNLTLDVKNKEIESYTAGKTRKLAVYVIARAFKIIVLMQKLHEDLWFEFHEQIENLGRLIAANKHFMRTAIQHGFDVNWLLTNEIPKNIDQIHKEIRSRGYLTTRVYIHDPNYSE